MKPKRINQLLYIALLMAAHPAVSAETKPFPKHWGEPPAIQTRDIRELPAGYGQGSGTMADWIQQHLDRDSAAKSGALVLTAADFMSGARGYYLDKGKWLAINPAKGKSAGAQTAFPFPGGKYHVTLHTVGESDGQSTYQIALNDKRIGEFTCPLGAQTFEEGAKFATTWNNIGISGGDMLAVSSQIASQDGKEFSRARIAKLEFTPADEATRAAVAGMAAAKPAVATKPAAKAPQSPRQPDGSGLAVISGELKQWHKVTLTLDGPYADESDNEPNPSTDLAFNVRFTHESGTPDYSVPGYFAADGDAANTSAGSGTKWRAHLSPDKAGRWDYVVSFTRGKEAAIGGPGQALTPFAGRSGSFSVGATDKTGRDFRAQGRLQYVGGHYLQFAGGSKEYFLKAGPDAPETLLGYADFDNTIAGKPGKVPLKTWQPHLQDWKAGDPTWMAGRGKGLIGALNYLSAKGVNAFSFLTYNAAGDGDNVWPFVERNDKMHYDCSKLDQWGIVFDHATRLGLYLHFKLQENEMDDDRLGAQSKPGRLPESLDGGKLGPERKLYCRELIARFGHALALNWNIGEENTQSSEEVRDMVKFLHDTDPYKHHIVLHTFPPQQEQKYDPLLGNQSLLTGVSLQNGWNTAHQRALHWLSASEKAGRPWVVAQDEQNPAGLGVPQDIGYKGTDGIAIEKAKEKQNATTGDVKSKAYTMHDIRKATLWGNLMAGGAGVEYYFGYALPENDLVCEDFRSRDKSWDYCRIALDFFRDERIPFAAMKNADALIGNDRSGNSKYCFAKAGEIYLVYLPDGGTTDLDLSGTKGPFSIQWLNPRAGGPLTSGSVKTVSGGATSSIGQPADQPEEDWLAIIRR